MKDKIIRGLKIGGAVLLVTLALGVAGKIDRDGVRMNYEIGEATVNGLYEGGF